VSNKISQNVTLLKTEGDCILWLKIDSCLFSFDNDLFLCLSYNIPTCSSREALIQCSIYDLLCENVLQFKDVYENRCTFLIAGKLNSRVGKLKDYVENENVSVFLNILPDDYILDENLVTNGTMIIGLSF